MLVNMTPHALNILPGNADRPNDVLTLPPSGRSVRVASAFEPVGTFDDVNLFRAVYGAVETIDNATKSVVRDGMDCDLGGSLPPVVEGTVYVVSGQALEALKASGRSDFAAPGELVRDADGKPVGCNGLKVN